MLKVGALYTGYPSEKGEIVNAARNVSLEVPEGKLSTLPGPGGCGKTTTLRSTAGLKHSRRTLRVVVVSIAALFGVANAYAQTSAPPAMYQGADRMQRLIDGAKKEGALTVYTSMAAKDDRRIVSAFEKKYGIKVTVWRSGKNMVLQRTVTESRAGRNEADFVLNPSPEMEALHREKLLQPVSSPVQKDLIPAALPAHREWTGVRVYVFVQSYNTDKVKPEELPKTYADLLDPRWKGRIGIESKQQEWFYTLVHEMGEEKGLKYFQDLVAKNKMTQHNGNSLLTNMVLSGEVPMALGVYSYLADQSRAAGAPINYISLSPTIAYTDGIGILSKAPHPNAATLYYDFMLTEGQKILSENKAVTTNKRDQPLLAKFKPVYMNSEQVLDSDEKWQKIYDDTLNGRIAAR